MKQKRFSRSNVGVNTNFLEQTGTPLDTTSRDNILDFHVGTRVIYLSEGINPQTTQIFLSSLAFICEYSNDYTTPVTVLLNSNYGGDVHAMFGMVDQLRISRVPIHTQGVGTVMSAATGILIAGLKGERSVSELTTVMIHDISTMMEGTGNDLAIEIKYTQLIQEKMIHLLEKSTKKPARFWKTSLKRNLYLTSKECLDYGIIDKIL